MIRIRGELTVGWALSCLGMILVTATTIAGNSCVLSAVRRAPRAPSHYPLASLATADLLLGLAVLPVAQARDLFIFHLPWVICASWSTLDVLCCTASILSICALGWERWCGITAPLSRAKRYTRAKISAALIWPVSTLIALPTAFIPSPRNFLPGESPKACTVNTNVGYVFSSISFSFYVPASIMIFLYARILQALAIPPPIRAHRSRATGNENNNKTCAALTPAKTEKMPSQLNVITTPRPSHLSLPDVTQTSCPVPSPLKTSNSPGGIIPRQRRATRTIVRLMALFLICWTPFFVMLPVDSLCECVTDAAWQWCTWLGYANSALNPLVYAAASPSVRRALRSSVIFSSSTRTCTDVQLTPNV